MVYEERNTWVGLIVSVVGVGVYVLLVLQQAGDGPLTDVVWWPLMLWTIVGSIVASIVISILWGSLPACAIATASENPINAIETSPTWAAASDRRSW